MLKVALRRLLLFPPFLLFANAAGFMVATYLTLRWGSVFGEVNLPEVFTAYREYLVGFTRGEFGQLPGTKLPVLEFVFLDALPKTLILLLLALVFASVVGVSIGFLSVNRRLKRANPLALTLSLGGFSMPSFYLGIAAIYLMILFSGWTGKTGTLLPALGYGLDTHLILPTLVLAARPTAEIARLTSELMAEELRREYVRVARAKGLPWRLVMIRHAFRNVFAPVIATLGSSMQYLVSSLIVIEGMFSWSGIGEALTNVLTGRMANQWLLHPSLTATLFTVTALLFLCATLITDVSVRVVDPRLRK